MDNLDNELDDDLNDTPTYSDNFDSFAPEVEQDGPEKTVLDAPATMVGHLAGAGAVSPMDLSGTWVLQSTEGVDEFVATLGVDWNSRKGAVRAVNQSTAFHIFEKQGSTLKSLSCRNSTLASQVSTTDGGMTWRLQAGSSNTDGWIAEDFTADGRTRDTIVAGGFAPEDGGIPATKLCYFDGDGHLIVETRSARGALRYCRHLRDPDTMVNAVTNLAPGAPPGTLLRTYSRSSPDEAAAILMASKGCDFQL
jgi:hypothetical protein